MYTLKTIEEILKSPPIWDNFKLCYIDDIPLTNYEMTPESKEFTKGWGEKEWKKWHDDHTDELGHYQIDYKINYHDVPNPIYIKGSQELYAYFTPIDLIDQWGDDWDDAPYEWNAEMPYDDNFVEVSFEEQQKLQRDEYAVSLRKKNPDGSFMKLKRVEHEILRVPFAISEDVYVKQPKDYAIQGNSPFSVSDINSGAVAWLHKVSNGKACNGLSIFCGVSPQKFIELLNQINNNDYDRRKKD